MNTKYYAALRNYCTRYGIDWRFDTIQNPITLIWEVLRVVNALTGDMEELQKAMEDLITSLEGTIEQKVIDQLQEWLTDGTLETIIGDAFEHKAPNVVHYPEMYGYDGTNGDSVFEEIMLNANKGDTIKLSKTYKGNINLTKPNIRIEGGVLDGTIIIDYTQNDSDDYSIISGVTFTGTREYGIKFIKGFRGIIENCHFDSTVQIGVGSDVQSPFPQSLRQWKIVNSFFRGDYGIKFTQPNRSSAVYSMADVVVTGNSFQNKITNVWLEFSDGAIIQNNALFLVDNQSLKDVGIYFYDSPNVIVSNNLIFECGSHGIQIEKLSKATTLTPLR